MLFHILFVSELLFENFSRKNLIVYKIFVLLFYYKFYIWYVYLFKILKKKICNLYLFLLVLKYSQIFIIFLLKNIVLFYFVSCFLFRLFLTSLF